MSSTLFTSCEENGTGSLFGRFGPVVGIIFGVALLGGTTYYAATTPDIFE